MNLIKSKTFLPTEAQNILDNRSPNRRINPKQVDELAYAMRTGKFLLNGETVKFFKDRLVDGQHRMSACVKSGVPLTTSVIHTDDPKVMATVDVGLKRSNSNVLQIAGRKNTKTLASALGVLKRADTGRIPNAVGGLVSIGIPTYEIEDEVNAHPGMQLSAALADNHCKRIRVRKSSLACLHYMLRRSETKNKPYLNREEYDSRSLADVFIVDNLCKGIGLSECDPVYAFRTQIALKHTQREKIKGAVTFTHHFLIKGGIITWNKWIKGVPCKRLVIKDSTDLPAIDEN
jgi:hypothetical protein